MKERILKDFREILIEREVNRTKDFSHYSILAMMIIGFAAITDVLMLSSTAVDAYHKVYKYVLFYFIIFCIVTEGSKALINKIGDILNAKSRMIQETADTIVKEYESRTDESWEMEGNVLTLYYTFKGQKYADKYDFTNLFNLQIQGVEGNICLDRNVLRVIQVTNIKDMLKKSRNLAYYEVLIPDYYDDSVAEGLNKAYKEYVCKLIESGQLMIENKK